MDGCKSGWFSVSQNTDGTINSHIFNNLSELINFLGIDDDLILGIDMPVILPEIMPRKADQLARKLLGKKASSIFSAPTHEILQQPDYQKASMVSKSLFGKSISLQSWYLFPKILEVQTILNKNNVIVYEIHPELSFRAMNNNEVVLESKKTPEGFLIRKQLIQKNFEQFNFNEIRKKYLKKNAHDDDILDAMAVLWTTKRVLDKTASYLPDNPEKTKMQIVF